ncbi:MAG: hypothetical protein HYR55_13795 [Acidobacteria bacterium]|nr:hypothetical protein [Acidobacteriota bacterium]MBI3658690.1 hypothetical protein [Acidobacteriota bacterium]
MDFRSPIELGRTGLKIGRLGIGASYGASASSLEAAFEQGLNYFYWGSRRHAHMASAIRSIARRGRDRLVVAVESYSRVAALVPYSVESALKRLSLDYAEILIMGWFDKPPHPRLIEAAQRLKERGLIRFLAISCHNRPTFQTYIRQGLFDILMVRYNAAHRGAEKEVFPYLPRENSPGVTCYTATRWSHLCRPSLTPAGLPTPRGSDCYRFVLTHPQVHLCMTGPKNDAEMKEALLTLERGPMSEDELAWMRQVGDYIHAHVPFFLPIKLPFAISSH